ncbi:hypothetical protein Cri9333_4211 [Crinalium epipsammum PCC 9333]|uniref:Uncharacterized protein n=1 Tax=Crinalium epipsammum PCC 9333 TaxID=1173022 RepID=K9W5G8_9CYAN|nr:hypothetical protein [Crinalium epipsammum]AFZ15002.1 hypothetical protein Cri9333_4211 [Crinalium epipsammum PCC 9333]
MMFEFLILYRKEPDTNIHEVLSDTLTTVLQDNLNEFESEEVQQMIILSTERLGNQSVDESGNSSQNVLLGFSLDLPNETNEPQTVVYEFAKALIDNTNPISHIVKFEDSLLQANLAHWAEEIFALEMKLRRVLTLIYLYAYQDENPFDLLCEESTQPMVKERPKPEQMKAVLENQFFHLTFSQYVGLNQRPELKIADIVKNIKNTETYEVFRAELSRVPVEHEDDAVLLAGLKARMEAIEAMRNCVAHNRRPPRRVIENYENVQPLLNQLLDDYLNQWL